MKKYLFAIVSFFWFSQMILAQGNYHSDAEAKAIADSIVIKLAEGESFTALAIKYSEDPGSASKGGELGWIKKDALVPEYVEGALTLKPGTYSLPIKSSFGYHIIFLIAQSDDSLNTRHILIRSSN